MQKMWPGELSFLFVFMLFFEWTSAQNALAVNFRVKNIPKNTWIPGVILAAASTDYHYCSYLCNINLASCSAFTINTAGQCQTGTFNAYIPLRTDGGVGMKVYVANNQQAIAGQAPQLNLTTVPHVAYFSYGAGNVDLSLNQTGSPPITLPTSPSPPPATPDGLFNFYRGGTFYSCAGGSMSCYSARIGQDATFVQTNQTMLYIHYNAPSVDMGDIVWVFGGCSNSACSSTIFTYTEYWQGDAWHPGPNLPTPFHGPALVAISPTQALVIGGLYNGVFQPYNWLYDFGTDLWTKKTNYAGSTRANMAAAGTVEPV